MVAKEDESNECRSGRMQGLLRQLARFKYQFEWKFASEPNVFVQRFRCDMMAKSKYICITGLRTMLRARVVPGLTKT